MLNYSKSEMNLAGDERRFVMAVISKGVCVLKDAREISDGLDGYARDKELRERMEGCANGMRNAARDIAGSGLSNLFGGMGISTINALEALAEREDVNIFRDIIVDQFYAELVKEWGR